MIVIFVQPSSCRKSRKKTALLLLLQPYLPKPNMAPENRPSQKENSWKAKCPIFKAIVAGFRGKVASKNRTLGVPGYYFHSEFLCFFSFLPDSLSRIGPFMGFIPTMAVCQSSRICFCPHPTVANDHLVIHK